MLNINIEIYKLEKIFLVLFLISIFLFKIPNLYIILFSNNPFLTTQALARILLVSAFIWKFFLYYKHNLQIFSTKESTIVAFLLIIFFGLQSLSIVNASNIDSFIVRYKDVIVGLLAFFTFYLYRNYSKKIIITILLSLPINFFYQLSLQLIPKWSLDFFKFIVYQKHFAFVEANLQRGRLLTDVYDEISIPFLLEIPQMIRKKNSILNYIFVCLISVLAFLSNFRSRLLMVLFGILGSLAIFRKNISLKYIFIFITLLIISGIAVDAFSNRIYNFSLVNRVLLQDQVEDSGTLFSRLNQIKNAINMGESNILGVGLGNYYDNISVTSKLYDNYSPVAKGADEYVHNIFGTIIAESGYPSFIIFIIILILFIMSDIRVLRQNDQYKKSFVLSFWILFSFSMFNPIVPTSFQVLFWGIRGLLL